MINYLSKVASLRIEPVVVSETVVWSVGSGVFDTGEDYVWMLGFN